MANGTVRVHRHEGWRREGLLVIPRSRGAIAGFIILILGIWAAIIPFVGPYFNYAFLNDMVWYYTWQRLVFSILPGAAAFFGGLILLSSANRPAASFGSWLSLAAGVWLVIGIVVSGLWAALPGIGPALGGTTRVALEYLGYFYGVGAVITAIAGMSVGRLSVRSASVHKD